MPKFINRTGQRYGRLMVTSFAGRNTLRKTVWNCLCDCGSTKQVVSGDLTTGNTVSCGCYLKERITKHGGWNKSSYNTWRAMMRRCTMPTDKDYPRYGGAGIQVCQQWHEYKNFVADMGEPVGVQTLDRIDPYGDYSKENCRWASPTTQARNIRMSKANKSGYKGVIAVGTKWLAYISHNRKKYYSSICLSVEEAAQARKQLETKYWD